MPQIIPRRMNSNAMQPAVARVQVWYCVATKTAMYLLFAFNQWYPSGGVNDFVGAFPSLAAAKDAFDGKSEFAQIAKVEGDRLILVATAEAMTNALPRPRIWWQDVETALPTSPAALIRV